MPAGVAEVDEMLLGGGAFLQFHLAPLRDKLRDGHDKADAWRTSIVPHRHRAAARSTTTVPQE